MSIEDRENVFALITFTGTFTLSTLLPLPPRTCAYVTNGKTEGKRRARTEKPELREGETNGSHDETAMTIFVTIMDLFFV